LQSGKQFPLPPVVPAVHIPPQHTGRLAGQSPFTKQATLPVRVLTQLPGQAAFETQSTQSPLTQCIFCCCPGELGQSASVTHGSKQKPSWQLLHAADGANVLMKLGQANGQSAVTVHGIRSQQPPTSQK